MMNLPAIHLYHAPGSRSGRVKMLLDLLGFPYEQTLVNTQTGEHKTKAYLKVNPLGVVPGLVVGETPIVESGAQMMFLADLDPQMRLVPIKRSIERAVYYQWFVMTPSVLEPMAMPFIWNPRDRAARKEALRAIVLQTAMLRGPYCLGDQLYAIDVMVHWSMHFLASQGLIETGSVWHDYVERVGEQLDWNGY